MLPRVVWITWLLFLLHFFLLISIGPKFVTILLFCSLASFRLPHNFYVLSILQIVVLLLRFVTTLLLLSLRLFKVLLISFIRSCHIWLAHLLVLLRHGFAQNGIFTPIITLTHSNSLGLLRSANSLILTVFVAFLSPRLILNIFVLFYLLILGQGRSIIPRRIHVCICLLGLNWRGRNRRL